MRCTFGRYVAKFRDGRKWLGIASVAQSCVELSGPIIAVFYTAVISDWEFCERTDVTAIVVYFHTTIYGRTVY